MANSSATFDIGTKSFNYSQSNRLGTYSGVNLWLNDNADEQLTKEEIYAVPAGGSFSKQKDENGNDIILGYKSNPWSNTGRVLDVVNPFGTVQMASDILEALRQSNGIALNYAPFESGAIIPPHFEIGDAVSINSNHHGIYGFDTTASRLPKSRITAPSDEEIDHEYPFKSEVKSRALTRKFDAVQSQFIVQAGKINARVTRTGENESHTFGWSLTENGFYINNGEVRADGTDLFTFDSNGLHIKGDIEATTGRIGGDNGFVIQSGKLYSGKSTYDSTASGVYIGTDGISLGSGFKVNAYGNLTATSGTFGSLTINANSRTTQGTYYGGLSGCGGSVSSGLAYSGGNVSYGTISGLDQGLADTVVRVGKLEADSITTENLAAQIAKISIVKVASLKINNIQVKLNSTTFTDGNGDSVKITYWGT